MLPWVLLLAAVGNTPVAHLEKARQSFVDGDKRTSASELKKGAALIEIQSNQLPESEAGAIKELVKNLQQMSRDVQAGRLTDVSKIEQAIERAKDVAGGDRGPEPLKGVEPLKKPEKPQKTSQPTWGGEGSGSVQPDNPRGEGSQGHLPNDPAWGPNGRPAN